jgi:isoamylase
MDDADWDSGFARSVAVFLNGDAIPDRDPRGQHVRDDRFLLVLNAHHEPIDWSIPQVGGAGWAVVVDTTGGRQPGDRVDRSQPVAVDARSCMVLTQTAPPTGD